MTQKTTRCITCNKDIAYKTNKPKRCNACKNEKGTKARKNRKGGARPFTKWKKETQMFRLLQEIFNTDSIMNGYYSWLESPKGEAMQLDWFCPKYSVAFEYNGRQHYEYSTYFHKSKKAFKYLQECDKLKHEICKDKGVVLVPIRYDKSLTKRYLLLKLEESDKKLYNSLIKRGIIKEEE